MLNCKFKFTKKVCSENLSEEDAYCKIWDYWNALCNNGQVVGGFDLYTKNKVFYLTTVLPTEDSLSEKYQNTYVKQRREELCTALDYKVIREGKNLEYHTSCACTKPSWYYLYAEGESPLICGDCHRPVPLCKVPYPLGEKEHVSILAWQAAHKAMKTLWIHGAWDRFSYGQIGLPNSKLNREGKKLCKAYEKVLGVPVYLYLDLFYENPETDAVSSCVPHGLPNKTPPVCPECGGAWIDDLEFCKCEVCRLLYDSPAWK